MIAQNDGEIATRSNTIWNCIRFFNLMTQQHRKNYTIDLIVYTTQEHIFETDSILVNFKNCQMPEE